MAERDQIWRRIAVFVLCALIAGIVYGQSEGPVQPPKLPSESQIKHTGEIKVDVDLALVNVSVTDPLNRLVTGLEKENFRVFEDGIEQEVVTLSSEDVPVSIGLVFDMSGKRMSDKVDKSAPQAAVEFMRTAQSARSVFFWSASTIAPN